jgi:hypothetical protein
VSVDTDSPAGTQDQHHRHLVQFYGSAAGELVDNLKRYIAEGIAAGSAILIVATPEHTDAILEALPELADGTELARAITCLDAQATLDRFIVGGRPDWRLFGQTVGSIVRSLRRAAPSGTLRVYGEMVGLLWQAGDTEAAVCLEKFWNVLLADDEFALFCGYPIDVFAADFSGEAAAELLCTHTHVLAGKANADLAGALDVAMRDVFGAETDAVRERMRAECGAAARVAPAEAAMLWLRKNAPRADDILSRARTYYHQSA